MLYIFELMIVNIQYFTFIEINNIIIQKQILPYNYFPSSVLHIVATRHATPTKH